VSGASGRMHLPDAATDLAEDALPSIPPPTNTNNIDATYDYVGNEVASTGNQTAAAAGEVVYDTNAGTGTGVENLYNMPAPGERSTTFKSANNVGAVGLYSTPAKTGKGKGKGKGKSKANASEVSYSTVVTESSSTVYDYAGNSVAGEECVACVFFK